MFTSSDCDAEGDLHSSFQCGDYAENCPKNRTSDMEIRGKQRGAGSKQVTLGKHPNIYFAELDKRGGGGIFLGNKLRIISRGADPS